MKSLIVVAVSVAAVVLGACGGGADYSGLSDDEVREQADIQQLPPPPEADTVGYVVEYQLGDSDCLVQSILRGEEQIAFYTDAGETGVATTDDGELGLDTEPADSSVSEADCISAAEDALSNVQP